MRAVLNRFIGQHKLVEFEQERRTGDLAEIKHSETLRVATRNSAANYFVWRGQLLGFEYELADRFADHLGLRLEMVVADPDESLLALVRQGRADIAAAFLTPGVEEEAGGIAWSRPYHHAVHQVVTDHRDRSIRSIEDLAGRTFHVRTGSEAWNGLERLREKHAVDFAIEATPSALEPEAIIARVGRVNTT
ncbi:MAG: transporter substrate-binding domain-containing protein [Halofilum sp. (in: g-proteobacteria)]|nr:transporter substrate-binding domain-containing protein [Halofilum sp. (in: g-proteobacteria)]